MSMSSGEVRTVSDSSASEQQFGILIDSGADASIFPRSLLGLQQEFQVSCKLVDAQGTEIPVDAVQDMEVRLQDVNGKCFLLREKVAISDRV